METANMRTNWADRLMIAVSFAALVALWLWAYGVDFSKWGSSWSKPTPQKVAPQVQANTSAEVEALRDIQRSIEAFRDEAWRRGR
jgi:hypothetical protein